VVGHPDAGEDGGLAEAPATVEAPAQATRAGAQRKPARRGRQGERRLRGRMALSARGTASLGLVQARGWRQSARRLLGREKQAQGMPDDRMATGFEADAGLQRIELAVERVAQGDGDPHRQDAGGLVSCGTSLGQDRPPRTGDSAKTGGQWEHSPEEFIQKLFFVNRKEAIRHSSLASVSHQPRGPRLG
jgi:hypothetical protein